MSVAKVGGILALIALSVWISRWLTSTPPKTAANPESAVVGPDASANPAHLPSREQRLSAVNGEQPGAEQSLTALIDSVEAEKRRSFRLTAEQQAIRQQQQEHFLRQVNAQLPDTYHIIMADADRDALEAALLFRESLQQESANLAMERNIIDFVNGHDLSHKIELERVDCTYRQCEVRGREFDSIAWLQVNQDLVTHTTPNLQLVFEGRGFNPGDTSVFLYRYDLIVSH